ncbi:MAG: hypothetical protein WB762_10915, partial [Candidatus Sulfotelmatobacter sp.]
MAAQSLAERELLSTSDIEMGARRRSEDLAVSFFVASVLQYVILTDDCLYDCLELLMPDSLV